jgi:vacuolar-type H+-ATPase subunit F/Vma7
MSELLVIGEPEIIEGFGLTGAKVESVTNPDRVEWLITRLLRSRNEGIVVVTESLYEKVPEKTRAQAEASGRLLFVTLPRPAEMELWEDREDLIGRIVRRAIGYRVKIRR